MQKMGEIYKYAQPGMMAAGMMNPVLNPGNILIKTFCLGPIALL